MSALELARALVRRADGVADADTTENSPPNETNENNELIASPPRAEGLISFHSFNSSCQTVAREDRGERAALIEWAEGYAALCSMTAPSAFSPERWVRIVDAAGSFLDRWAADAIRCGWSDLDVFGCDRDRPDARFDCMGLLMLLDRCEIVGIDEGGADLVASPEARLRYRRRPLPAATISLWQLGKARGPEARAQERSLLSQMPPNEPIPLH